MGAPTQTTTLMSLSERQKEFTTAISVQIFRVKKKIFLLLMQQTPKPLAQVPDLIPPLFSQSFELRQVPLLPLLLWQGSFLKETIVNSDKTEIKLIHSTFSFWLNHCIIRLETDYLPSEIGRLNSIKHIIKTFPPLEK